MRRKAAAKSAGEKSGAPLRLNQTELASALQVSRMSLSRWNGLDGFPKPDKSRRYDVQAVRDWIIENDKLQGSGRRTGEGGASEIAQLRARLLEQEVEKNDLELAQTRSELVDFAEVKELVAKALSPLARRLKDLAPTMAAKCNPADIAFAKAALADWSQSTLKLMEDQCLKLK